VTSTDLPGKRILVIEDYEDSAHVLSLFLEARGHRVEVARTGAEGIARARAFGPDVILSDLGLPDEDGFAVARRIRADDGLKDVWLIALTAYSVPHQAFAAGFDDYMRKPVNLERLAALLEGPPPARRP
jgi:CheY-like chemotaxis protein